MYKKNDFFDFPAPDAVLWRYLSFTKFVSLLEKKALFFARADQLGDPFEGSLSQVNATMNSVQESHVASSQKVLTDFRRESRRFTLINCWHESSHESAAMWKLYSRESDGVVIKSICKSFAESLVDEEDIFIGRVHYVDYKQFHIPVHNVFGPYLHKRKGFEHEREVRAIIQKLPTNDGSTVDLSKNIFEVGKYHRVNISSLIQEVVVAPYAEEWFFELVVSTAKRYELKAPVNRSDLADEPTWG